MSKIERLEQAYKHYRRSDDDIPDYASDALSALPQLLAVVRAAERLTYKVLAQREIQDDDLSELPISELKDTLDRLESGE